MNEIPLSLYVHLPWCVKKCPYCDFNSHEIKTTVPEDEYISALIADLHAQQKIIQEREIVSIFLGGGTPSIFASKNIKLLFDTIFSLLNVSQQAEITIEANPGTMDQENFSGFRDAGINRISIGAQSFTNSQLQTLGRIHDADTAFESIQTAKQAGFNNINIDLMFALPNQTIGSALHDVEQAIALQPTHISYYQLTLEPNTNFYRHPPNLPDTQLSWDIQQAGVKLLAKHGYTQYEISAYAQDSFQCLHNTNYWQFGDYLGIGAGAHQKLSFASDNKIIRSEKPKHPQQYMKAMKDTNFITPSHTLTQQDIIFEFMLNALRLKNGFTEAQFVLNTGLEARLIADKIDLQLQQGLLMKQGEAVRCSDQGYRFLDDLLQSWLPQSQTVGNIKYSN